MAQQYVFSCSFCRKLVNFPHTCFYAPAAPPPPPPPPQAQYLLVQPTFPQPVIPAVVCQPTPIVYYQPTYPVVQMVPQSGPQVLQPQPINLAAVSPVCPAHQTVHSAGSMPTTTSLPHAVATQPQPFSYAPVPDMAVSQPAQPEASPSAPAPVSPTADLPAGPEASAPGIAVPVPP